MLRALVAATDPLTTSTDPPACRRYRYRRRALALFVQVAVRPGAALKIKAP